MARELGVTLSRLVRVKSALPGHITDSCPSPCSRMEHALRPDVLRSLSRTSSFWCPRLPPRTAACGHHQHPAKDRASSQRHAVRRPREASGAGGECNQASAHRRHRDAAGMDDSRQLPGNNRTTPTLRATPPLVRSPGTQKGHGRFGVSAEGYTAAWPQSLVVGLGQRQMTGAVIQ
jgi:hypothetical protein